MKWTDGDKMEKLGRNDKCWCGSGKKYKQCHCAMDEKIASYAIAGHMVPEREMIKNPQQIEGIRKSGEINIAVLDYVAENIRLGMSTEEIDQMVYKKTKELGGFRRHYIMTDFLKAYAPQRIMKSATVFRRRIFFLRMETLSMWMPLQYITVIFRILPECSASEM